MTELKVGNIQQLQARAALTSTSVKSAPTSWTRPSSRPRKTSTRPQPLDIRATDYYVDVLFWVAKERLSGIYATPENARSRPDKVHILSSYYG